MPTARLLDVALSVAALATSILTLVTAVIGVLVGVRELRKNTRITSRAASVGDATHGMLTDVVHNGDVVDPSVALRTPARVDSQEGSDVPPPARTGRHVSSSDAA